MWVWAMAMLLALAAAASAADVQTVFADPWSAPGHWYRGQLHMHTTQSDGKLTPEAALKYYHDRGYQFASITDHNIITEVAEHPFPDFLALPGVEANLGHSEHARDFHLNGIGVSALPAREGRTVQQVVDELNAQGAFILLDHPYWSSLTFSDLAGLRNYHALEVQNWGCEAESGTGYAMTWWDDALLSGERVRAVATDDVHHYAEDGNGGWVMVKAPELTRTALLTALKEGRFYSTEGPEIKQLTLTDRELTVKCSPASRITLRERGPHGAARLADSRRSLTEAAFDLAAARQRAQDMGWNVLRVELLSLEGKRAWSNPIWFERPAPAGGPR